MGGCTRTWTTSGSAPTTATGCRRRCATSAPPPRDLRPPKPPPAGTHLLSPAAEAAPAAAPSAVEQQSAAEARPEARASTADQGPPREGAPPADGAIPAAGAPLQAPRGRSPSRLSPVEALAAHALAADPPSTETQPSDMAAGETGDETDAAAEQDAAAAAANGHAVPHGRASGGKAAAG